VAQPAPTPAAPATAERNDYAGKANWLCWPGRDPDACKIDLTTTVVKADGSMATETFKAAANPPVDCFYVYPTVSRDNSVLSDMTPGAEEQTVVKHQLARFAAKCRVFAPMYRQFTLTALRAMIAGLPMPGGAAAGTARRETPYQDVRDAWNYYLAHENHGRGVVLIGHSQGSGVLSQLIKNEIDGKPNQKLLVSAILMGTVLSVPKGADVDGEFKSVPLCHATSQLGCVIAYASFRDTAPPPDNTRFGRPRTPAPGMVAACVNPASLGGGKGELHAYLAADASAIAAEAAPPPAWVQGKTVSTPFVSVPGLLTAECVSNEKFNYLSVHVNADPADPRTDDIAGDVVVGGQVLKDWGLHLIDANLAMGDLVDIVGEESKAWARRKS
jgi:hypothetical protein